MIKRSIRVLALLAVSAVSIFGFAQQQQLPDSPTPQTGTQQPFPTPNPSTPTRPVPNPENPTPTEQLPPSTAEKAGPAAPAPAQQKVPPPAQTPSPTVRTVPPGSSNNADIASRDQLNYTISTQVNFVFVPVTVKSTSGSLVTGLTMRDFSILENNEKQKISYFTSDPFPISAAILIDTGMPDIALKKVAETFSALTGAFSQYDEVAVYTFGNVVKRQQDYIAALNDKVTVALRRSGEIQGRGSGPMMADNPMTAGPSVNGRPVDPAAPSPVTRNTLTAEPSRVLNDAILRAAVDLSKRERTRRKMIFVISDGREQGSTASYADVLKVLLSNEVSVYAVAVDAGAMPLYNKVNRLRLPRQGYSNILPKYAAATGGEVFTEFTREAIERSYAGMTEQARNQYTIGYNSPAASAATAGTYRSIEVRVLRPGLKVVARDGYYPLPPARK